MKNYVKYGISALVFVAVLALAVFGYKYFTPRYQPEEPAGQSESGSAESAEKAERARDFTVTDTHGNAVSLSDFFGKPIVVNFWATWCGPCESELPAFDKLYAENGDDIVFLMVNLTDGYRDTVSGVKRYVADNGYSFPVYFDTEYSAANAYYIKSIPLTVFIDENGVAVDSHIGSMSEESLAGRLDALLG